MNLKLFNIISLLTILMLTSNCASTKKKSVHGDEPLIDPSKVIVEGTKEMQEKVKYGPNLMRLSLIPQLIKEKQLQLNK